MLCFRHVSHLYFFPICCTVLTIILPFQILWVGSFKNGCGREGAWGFGQNAKSEATERLDVLHSKILQ